MTHSRTATEVTNDIRYAGVNDHRIKLFEGHFEVPLGMAYNSYVILDQKIAVMDTSAEGFEEEWLRNVEQACGSRKPDYLVIQHLEPDHSSCISAFLRKYPDAAVVSSAMGFKFMEQFYPESAGCRRITVKEGDKLSLGTHELSFIGASMVHWPEVMMTYDSTDKVLFSADGFGKFGANDTEDPEGWICEARRYYFGIVGKFGTNVQNVLKKAKGLEICHICSLHGPVLNEKIADYVKLYDTWSSYEPETEGVAIFYTSVYGRTRAAAQYLAERLRSLGAEVKIADLAEEDEYEAVENAFRYSKAVFATTTYNTGIFPYMRKFLGDLKERNYQKRKIGLIENGTWAPMAAKGMKAALEGCPELVFAEPVVTIKSAMTDANRAQLDELAKALI